MILVELDARRRASLARVVTTDHKFFLAHVEEDGTIILTPAVVVSQDEAIEKGLDGTPASG